MTDERYERSADMRLLELQREALGKAPRIIGSTRYTDTETNAETVEDDAVHQRGTILAAAIDAQPRSGLIPGALITIALSVGNDGDAAASGVHVSLPLPAGTAYRPGTLAIDGVAVDDLEANELFEAGITLGTVEPGGRRTVVVKGVIEPGFNDIVLLPHMRAASGAILGLRALRLTRSRVARTPVEAERPFYESDDGESGEIFVPPPPQSTLTVLQPRELPPVVEPAAPVAAGQPVEVEPAPLSSVMPVRQPPEPTPESTRESTPEERIASAEPLAVAAAAAVPEQAVTPIPVVSAIPALRKATKAKAKAEPKPRAKPKSKPARETIKVDVEPSPRKPPASAAASKTPLKATTHVETVAEEDADAPVPIMGHGGPILTVRLDRKRLATLSRLFSGPSLGMIAHYLMLNALAATDALPGDGKDTAIATFVVRQEQLLSRALIATRLGKAPSPDDVGAVLPPFPPMVAQHTKTVSVRAPAGDDEALLVRAFAPAEIAFMDRMLANTKAPAFLQAAQLFVGLCANGAVVSHTYLARRVRQALTAYAALATAEISRIFLRARLSGQPELFKPTDPTFDDAARTVIETLADLFA